MAQKRMVEEEVKGLLLDINELSVKRAPDLLQFLVEISGSSSIPAEFPESLRAVEVPVGLNSVAEVKLLDFMRRIKAQYQEEVSQVKELCKQQIEARLDLLKKHAHEGRPVTGAEVKVHVYSVDRKFHEIRFMLKQKYDEWVSQEVNMHIKFLETP